MCEPKRNTIIFLVFIVLVFSMESDGEVTTCVESEREALLKFKEGLVDKYGMLSSWGSGNECCKWEGIQCSNTTGNVIGIELVGNNWLVDGSSYYLGGVISSALLSLHNLNVLNLSGNDFGGNNFPKFISSMSQLQHLDLYSSNFSGTLPLEIRNLTNLSTLDLSSNLFFGTLPSEIGNLSNLRKLVLSWNHFSGDVPPRLWSLANLEYLDLSGNDLTSSTYDTSFNMSTNHVSASLRTLDLRNNRLKRLPSSIWRFSKLEGLRVSSNSLEDTITEVDLAKLHNLKMLDLSFNPLTLDIRHDWTPPFQLSRVGLSGCKVGPHFPQWIRTNISLLGVDLSNNGIKGEVPIWFWSLSHEVIYLNLSHNQLSGSISEFSSINIQYIDVSANKFSGPTPLLSTSMKIFKISRNMFSGHFSFMCSVSYQYLHVIDISNNQLAGKLPSCWENMAGLWSLNLENNNFSGEIPYALGSLFRLQSLQLGNNNFSGELPSTLKDCKQLQLVDIGDNMLTGSIGEYHETIVYLILRNNRFHGSIPPQICYLSRIQVLDLSGNDISGKIPQCFNNFTSLVKNISNEITPLFFSIPYHPAEIIDYATVLWKRTESEYRRNLRLLKLVDLSHNRLVGNIPSSFSSLKELLSLNLSRNGLTGIIDPGIGQMRSLESLDLSSNQLSGVIPVGITELNFLSVLDLSNNNLSGKIPTGTQLQLFDASAYAGNIGLCGSPLQTCPSTNNEARNVDEEDDGGVFQKEFGISITLGFIFGFWGVVGSLIVKESWRNMFYNFYGACEN